MKAACRQCNKQVFLAASDGLCPRCRNLTKEIVAKLKPVTVASTYPPEVVVDNPNRMLSLLSDVVLFSELPSSCPDCRRTFNAAHPPQRQFQTAAKLLMFIGVAASVALGTFLLVKLNVVRAPRMVVVVMACPFALIVSLPALVIAHLATSMKKVVPMKCRQCGWKKQFIIKKAY